MKNQPWNTSPSEAQVAAEIEWNLWSRKQPPFNLLEEGQTVYLSTSVGAGRSVISWEVEVTLVTKVPYATKRDAWAQLDAAFPQFDWSQRAFLKDGYTANAPDSGYMLAWDYRPIRRVDVPRPAELKFRPNGWLRLDRSDQRLRKWGILPAAGGSQRQPGPRRAPTRPPRQQDALRRRAVELRAMTVARRYLIGECGWEGGEILDTSMNHPYDFECTRGHRTVRVEVKGLSGPPGLVTLTRREVEHARTAGCPVILIVVHDIDVIDTPNGPKGRGGTLEAWNPWRIDDGKIAAAAYYYQPPPVLKRSG